MPDPKDDLDFEPQPFEEAEENDEDT